MKTYSSAEAKSKLDILIRDVWESNDVVSITSDSHMSVLMIRVPKDYNPQLSAETNLLAKSKSFDFLRDERDLYNDRDLTEAYV